MQGGSNEGRKACYDPDTRDAELAHFATNSSNSIRYSNSKQGCDPLLLFVFDHYDSLQDPHDDFQRLTDKECESTRPLEEIFECVTVRIAGSCCRAGIIFLTVHTRRILRASSCTKGSSRVGSDKELQYEVVGWNRQSEEDLRSVQNLA